MEPKPQKKNKTWSELVSDLKHSKKLLAGSSAILRTTSGSGFYLEIELSEENKDSEDKIVDDDKLLNEVLELVIPWIKTVAKSDNFRGIFFVKSHASQNKIFNYLNEMGAGLTFINTHKKRTKDGSNTNDDSN